MDNIYIYEILAGIVVLILVLLTVGIPWYLGRKVGSWVVKKYFQSWEQISVPFLDPGSWKVAILVIIVSVTIGSIIVSLGRLPAGTNFQYYIYRALMGQPQVPVFVVGHNNIQILAFFIGSFAVFLLESYLQSNKGFGQA